MNENSFKIKELAILLATAVLAIYATDKSSKVLLVSIFPTIILWIKTHITCNRKGNLEEFMTMLLD
jgi:hypothetical protein